MKPEPTLVFSVNYQGSPGGALPSVVWMWVPPTPGMIVEVGMPRRNEDGGGVLFKRCKVVDAVIFTYGSEGKREYAGEMTLAVIGDR